MGSLRATARRLPTPSARATPDLAGRLPPPRWARVEQVQLIRREVREYLPAGAVELLLSGADFVVEGGDELGATSGAPARRVYATVMVTIPLPRSAKAFRERPDGATAVRLAELLESTPLVARKLAELARPELAEIAGVSPAALEISLEHQARAEGTDLLIDGDAVAVVRE